MDKAILVEKNINDGRRFIEALDNANFTANGAFWRCYPELDEWKFIIVSNLANEEGPINLYSKVENILENMENQVDISLDDVKIVDPSDRDIKLLKIMIKTPSDAIAGLRFSRNTINGVYFEDLYIYRMS